MKSAARPELTSKIRKSRSCSCVCASCSNKTCSIVDMISCIASLRHLFHVAKFIDIKDITRAKAQDRKTVPKEWPIDSDVPVAKLQTQLTWYCDGIEWLTFKHWENLNFWTPDTRLNPVTAEVLKGPIRGSIYCNRPHYFI